MEPIQTYIDLHTHSTESDGTLSPGELIALAGKQKLRAIALSDHDTVSGLPEARASAEALGIELVPGVELSTDHNGMEVHILGYYIDESNTSFLLRLKHFQEGREDRNRKMVKKLQEEGFDFTYQELCAAFPDCVLTRAHFARFLFDRGYVKSMDAVFHQYIGNHCRCYVPREKLAPKEAIKLIHNGGGLAFFAHPILCGLGHDSLDAFLGTLKKGGLDGLEAVYSTYTPRDERLLRALAKKHELLISGGSDFHGSNKPDIALGAGKGDLRIPYEILAKIKEHLPAHSV